MAGRKEEGDPRLKLPEPEDSDIRPVIALPRRGLPIWTLVALAVLAGIILFAVLDARRRTAQVQPEGPVRADTFATPMPPPPLLMPPAPVPAPIAAPAREAPPPMRPVDVAGAAPLPAAPAAAPSGAPQ